MVLLSGCATGNSDRIMKTQGNYPPTPDTRIFKASFDKVFTSAMLMGVDLDFDLAMADNASGIIAFRRGEVTGKLLKLVPTASLFIMSRGNGNITVKVRIKLYSETSNTTTLKLFIEQIALSIRGRKIPRIDDNALRFVIFRSIEENLRELLDPDLSYSHSENGSNLSLTT